MGLTPEGRHDESAMRVHIGPMLIQIEDVLHIFVFYVCVRVSVFIVTNSQPRIKDMV